MNRKYDLDYLQWLQKNARNYIIGLSILTFFVVMSICMYFEPWQPQSSVAFWTQSDSNQAVAEHQIPEIDTETEPQQDDDTIKEGTDTVQPQIVATDIAKVDTLVVEQKNTSIADETEKQQRVVDFLTLQNTLPGFTVPCSANLVYSYGLGYDPIHEDYRFHNELCYQASGIDVLAAADGMVQHVDLNSEWQLTLRCGLYQICYKGLQTCGVNKGDMVTGGTIIGTAGERLYVKVMH